MLAAFGMLALRFTAGEASGGTSSDRYPNDDHVPENIFALRQNEPYIVSSWGLGMRQRAEEVHSQVRVCLLDGTLRGVIGVACHARETATDVRQGP